MDFFIAGIIMFGGNFAPRYWAMCEGQLLAISQNQALFSLLGTMYGGDGRTTFALPDLRGRVPMGFGTGSGLPTYIQGMRTGALTHTLSVNELAGHSHSAVINNISAQASGLINVSDGAGDINEPGDAYLATTSGGHKIYNATRSGTATLASDALSINVVAAGGSVEVGSTGSNQNFSLMQPSIAMNYIIAMQGIFPSRG